MSKMMPLVVTIPHSLGKEEALQRVRSGLTNLSERHPVLTVEEEIWIGDRMAFRVSALGQVAAGTVDIAEDYVRLEVILPALLQGHEEVVRAAVEGRGRLMLER
jgi:hypothetical protein